MKFINTIKDVFVSSLPLAIIIAVVFGISPMAEGEAVRVALGYAAVVIGQTIFLVGMEGAIIPIGKIAGSSLVKLKKVMFVVVLGFLFGLLATVAEPALTVMAGQVNSINPLISRMAFVWIVGAGIGVAVGFALLRILKKINIKAVFLVLYSIVFAAVLFVPEQFRALAFDASGAATGDVSVPFILALGVGVSTTANRIDSDDNSFGIVGIASVGPILAVFVCGMMMGNGSVSGSYTAGQGDSPMTVLLGDLAGAAGAVVPIVAAFVIFQILFVKLHRKQLVKILLSSIIVVIGLCVFLTGIDFGFAYAGKYIGDVFADVSRPQYFQWILPAVGFVLGFSIALTEPAVSMLGRQVEDITVGHVKKRLIRLTLATGIGFAGMLSLLKILTGINILFFLVPLYAIALTLMIFTPKLFVGLAFDSGGVAGGAITSAFLTPLTLGVSQTLGQEVLVSGFGMIAFISVMPLIAIQALGIGYSRKLKRLNHIAAVGQENFKHKCVKHK